MKPFYRQRAISASSRIMASGEGNMVPNAMKFQQTSLVHGTSSFMLRSPRSLLHENAPDSRAGRAILQGIAVLDREVPELIDVKMQPSH
jgi:hypothetical protein